MKAASPETTPEKVGSAATEAAETTAKIKRHKGLKALKFWLMPFVCLASFGLAVPFGDVVSRLCLFAPIAFYILCGFASAYGEEESRKIADKKPDYYGRVLKRTAIRFFVLLGVFLVLNLAFYLWTGTLDGVIAFSLKKRTIFNFVVLCLWPFQIGETIWFLQALLYARIMLWLMNRWNLMRYYKAVMVLTVLGMILFGELAGVIGFHFHGYTSIPGNGLTRALPYMLIGRFLFEKKEKLAKVPSWAWIVTFVLGIAAALGEWILLGMTGYLVYTGHFIGYGIMAIAACGFFLRKEDMKSTFAVKHGAHYAWRIYYLSQPVGHLLLILAAFWLPQYYGVTRALAGLFVYLLCLLIAFIMGIRKTTKRRKKTREERFSLRLFLKHWFKDKAKEREKKKQRKQSRGQFSHRRFLKHWFKDKAKERERKKQRKQSRGRFSLWLFFKQGFKSLARKRRARKYQAQWDRSHRHHAHRHHSHGHHSHEHYSEERPSQESGSKNTDKPE